MYMGIFQEENLAKSLMVFSGEWSNPCLESIVTESMLCQYFKITFYIIGTTTKFWNKGFCKTFGEYQPRFFWNAQA